MSARLFKLGCCRCRAAGAAATAAAYTLHFDRCCCAAAALLKAPARARSSGSSSNGSGADYFSAAYMYIVCSSSSLWVVSWLHVPHQCFMQYTWTLNENIVRCKMSSILFFSFLLSVQFILFSFFSNQDSRPDQWHFKVYYRRYYLRY